MAATEAPAAPVKQAALHCATDGKQVIFELPPSGTLLRLKPDHDVVWLEVKERGQEVAIEGGAGDMAVDIPVPLRFGMHWAEGTVRDGLNVRRVEPDSARGSIAVTLHCSVSSVLEKHLAWLRRTSVLAKRIDDPLNPADLAFALAQISVLANDAPDVDGHALATHLHAQALLISGHSADAAPAFQNAEQEWLASGDADKALIARLARTEDLYRTGKYDAVLRIVDAQQGAKLRSYAQHEMHGIADAWSAR